MNKTRDPLYREAMILLACSDGEVARMKLSECLGRENESVWKAFFYCKIAESFARDGDLDKAIGLFDKALQIDDSPISLVSYAEFAANSLKDEKLSLELFEKALTTGRKSWDDPSSWDLFYQRTLQRIDSLGLAWPEEQ